MSERTLNKLKRASAFMLYFCAIICTVVGVDALWENMIEEAIIGLSVGIILGLYGIMVYVKSADL